MNPSKNNGNLRADFASEDIEVSAERTAHATLKHGKRVLEQKLAERTQELNRSLVDVRSLTAALDAAQQSERTHLATELHDYVAQLLVLGRMKLGHLQRLPLPSTGDAIVQEVDDVFANAVEYCQTLMAELSPPIH